MPIGPESLRIAGKVRAEIGAQVDAETRRLVAAWVREFNQLVPELEAALADLAAAGKDGRWPTRAQVARSSRARQALAHAEERLTALAATAEVNIAGAATDIINLAAEAEPRLIASQLPSTAGTTASLATRFDLVSPDAIDAIVKRSTEQITALTRPLSKEAVNVMRQELVRAVPVGDNPRQTAARMLARLEGGFNGGLTRALVICRTEILDASRAGAQAQEMANTDVLAGWVWSAQLDSRTCPSCWSQHGSEHPVEDPGPLDHQQGRCARMPKTKTWRELGFNLDEPPSVLPDAQRVFAGLPDADKLAVMGPSRLEALQSGRASWADLSTRRATDGWRDSFGVTPVSALPAA
jgi:hypothetical protein